MEIPATFADLLKLIGSPIFIGIVLSLIIKQWVWFANQQPTVKWLFVGAICIVLPILSRALTLYLPPSVLLFIEDWWPTLAVGLGIWVTSQVWNDVFNNRIATRKQSLFLKAPDALKVEATKPTK
jgi:hypothetical protein